MHMMDMRGPGSRKMMLLEGLWDGSESLQVREIARLIILHAGSSSLGWVGGAELVFQSKKSTGDYHDEMNSEHFESWFRDQLVGPVSS